VVENHISLGNSRYCSESNLTQRLLLLHVAAAPCLLMLPLPCLLLLLMDRTP
jgi:hypothetical protein